MRRTSTGRVSGLAEANHLAFLNHAKELHLHRGRDLADFVQEERPSRSGFEDAETILHGPGKGAARVPEEFALEERVRKRAAVDGDEGSARARRGLVQPPRETLLADAALARNQDGGIKGRHARREGHQPEHGGTVRAVLVVRVMGRRRTGAGLSESQGSWRATGGRECGHQKTRRPRL